MKRTHHLLFAIFGMLLLASVGCGRSSDYYVQRGNELSGEGKYADAVLNYRKAIQKDPKSGEAHYRLALTQLKVNERVAAFTQLSTAMQLMPNREDVQVQLANISLAAYLINPKRPQNLYQLLNRISEKMLARNPNSYDGLRIRGIVQKSDGKLSGAEQTLRRANAIRPMQPDVVVPLVETLFQENQAAEGENLAELLIERHKDFGMAYDQLYSHYMAQKRLREAEDTLKVKIANNPHDINPVFQLAFFYGAFQRNTEAANLIQKALAKSNNYSQPHLRVGEFYAALQRGDDALRQFDEGL